MRSATRSGPSASEAPSVRITNSSRPRRPTVSPARSMPRNGAATAHRSLSPASWPSESLVSLKLSRSMKHSATGPLVAPGPQQHLLGPVHRQLAIGQPGERVVQGLVGQQRLELLALGDVADVGHVAPDGGPVPLIGDHRLDVAEGAVRLLHAELLEQRRDRARPGDRGEPVPHVFAGRRDGRSRWPAARPARSGSNPSSWVTTGLT